MKVGFTYDLRADYLAMGYSEEETAEFDSEITIDAIADAIASHGHEVVRVGNIFALTRALAAGERFDLVFNIAEGLYGYGREAAVPALLEAYRIPYTFSDPLTLSVALHKGMAKRVVRDAGIPTPPFVIAEREADCELADAGLVYPLFAKPVAEGTGKGVSPRSRIDSREQLRAVTAELLQRFEQPVLIEEYLSGREFTVAVLGSGRRARSIGVMEILLSERAEQGVYSFTNKEKSEELVDYRLCDDATATESARVAVAAWRTLGCRHAGRVDIRVDRAGQPCFIEVNPLAGLHPTHSDLPMICGMVGIEFKTLIGTIIDSATLPAGLSFRTLDA